MKRKWIIMGLVTLVLAAYVYAYYTARRDYILVRRVIHHGAGEALVLKHHIIPGRFGPGKGGILVSSDLIGLCNLVFMPLRKLEEMHWNMKSYKAGVARRARVGRGEGPTGRVGEHRTFNIERRSGAHGIMWTAAIHRRFAFG